jgi:ferrous iron transport protein A
VQAVRGGAEVTGRLTALGLVAGAPIEVLQNRGRGPLLVRVRDARIALGRGEAVKVLVERTP